MLELKAAVHYESHNTSLAYVYGRNLANLPVLLHGIECAALMKKTNKFKIVKMQKNFALKYS